jgi:hypothetical protein
VTIAVELEPAEGSCPDVEYRWDSDTDILTARLNGNARGTGMSGSVEIEGTDGSWVVLEVAAGRIGGVEVAVWPDVVKYPGLVPPAVVEEARVLIPARTPDVGLASLEVETPLLAEADDAERVIHFRVGARREVRTVRLARDLLLDLDPQSSIAGLWLLNVPPFPST